MRESVSSVQSLIRLSVPANYNKETAMEPAKVFEKHQEEMNTLSAAISSIDKRCDALKPSVTEYNEKMRHRKDLRKQLAAKQREAKIVQQWFEGTTLIDKRFPLFADTKD